MSAERNTAREWRRALARQNALANEIAAACASGRVPDRRLVAEWSLASMRVYARENNLRPRECAPSQSLIDEIPDITTLIGRILTH